MDEDDMPPHDDGDVVQQQNQLREQMVEPTEVLPHAFAPAIYLQHSKVYNIMLGKSMMALGLKLIFDADLSLKL